MSHYKEIQIISGVQKSLWKKTDRAMSGKYPSFAYKTFFNLFTQTNIADYSPKFSIVRVINFKANKK